MTAFITSLDDDCTMQDVQKLLSSSTSSSLTLVVAWASFVPKCKILMSEIESLPANEENLGNVCLLQTDLSDELEELAIEMGLTNIPSFQIYKDGHLCHSSKDGDNITLETIRNALVAVSSPSCIVGFSKAECGAAPPTDADDIRQFVQQSYANTVNQTEACCVSVDPTLIGYSAAEILKAGEDANLGLGCGNPLSFAKLQPNEVVVDLGSGAGIDCFLAVDHVKPKGQVIGIDMTPDMIHKARNNAKQRKLSSSIVQFRLGEIEYLPVADASVDCVMSNCVINLSPDKSQVFDEIYRILKIGGRIALSDVVIRPDQVIPQELKTAEALACWVSGAPELESLDRYLQNAGFRNINVDLKEESKEVIKQWMPGSGAENYIVSAQITAYR